MDLNFDIFATPTPEHLGLRPEELDRNRPGGGSLAWLKEQAVLGVPLWAICANCDHSRLMEPAHLIGLVSGRLDEAAKVAERMRCRACSSKACSLVAASPIPEYAS